MDDNVKVAGTDGDVRVMDDDVTVVGSIVGDDGATDGTEAEPGETDGAEGSGGEDATAGDDGTDAADGAADAEDDAAEGDAADDDMRAELDRLRAELADAQARADELAERDARRQDEWRRFRERAARDAERERDMASERMANAFMAPLDDLDMAVTQARRAARSGDYSSFPSFVEGMSSLRNKLVAVMASEGADRIAPRHGDRFVPADHQAVARIEDATLPDDSVAQVMRVGWRMGGKVLRPAMVSVTYGGGKRKEEGE